MYIRQDIGDKCRKTTQFTVIAPFFMVQLGFKLECKAFEGLDASEFKI
jgi:hypothetical protein